MSNRHTETCLPYIYQDVWEDGFGARGWKLGSGVADPEIIASTAATGDRIPTSVFVHDILDHALCGLGASGHRNEAIALIQLSARTGVDPTADFAQMVDEDLLQGNVLGEALRNFLPDDLLMHLTPGIQTDAEAIARIEALLGRGTLRERLIRHFFDVGVAGAASARERFRSYGLDHDRRDLLGLALQNLLEQADRFVQGNAWTRCSGSVCVADECCRFEIREPSQWSVTTDY